MVHSFPTRRSSDPREEMVGLLLIQRLMAGPNDVTINADFATLAYQAIDD